MEKINKEVSKEVSKEVKKEMRINIDYINFIEVVIKEKLEKSNKEVLIKKYREIVKLRENNIKRVDNRNKRKELKNILEVVLKEREISLNEYNKVSEKVVNKIKEGESNYLKVEY